MKAFLIAILIGSFNLTAAVIKNNSVILVHPSKYYHVNEDTIKYTNNLLLNAKYSVGLYQYEPKRDPDWYANIDQINKLIYSRSGENELSFNKWEKEIKISLVGGYLTNCLGRATAHLITSFILNKTGHQSLTITLPLKGIFTGHLIGKNQLVPKTAYLESTQDDTIQGLSLYEVKEYLGMSNFISYLKEASKVAIIDKSPMNAIKNLPFNLEVLYEGHIIMKRKPDSKIDVRVLYL